MQRRSSRRSRAFSSSSESDRGRRSSRDVKKTTVKRMSRLSTSSDEQNRQQRLKKAGRMKRAPLLDYAIVEAVYSAMAGQAQRRASRHWLQQFAEYETASHSGAIKTERFIKCLTKMGVHLDNKKDYEALATCFQYRRSSRGGGEQEKAMQLVDYVSFVDFACNVRDSEKLSEIAETLRGSISKYDGKKQSSSSYNIAARLEKLDRHQRGWITATQFERALEREDQEPSFRLSAAQVSVLVDRFEYEYEKQQLGIDYMQFAQWLQPLLHLDVKKVYERVKLLIEEASEKYGWKLDEVFKAMDDDKNGEIDAVELKQALLEMGLPLTDAQIRCLADEYDFDGDGKIQYKEFLLLFLPPGKKRVSSTRNVHGRDRAGNNSETGSATDAIKQRRTRPKRNIRNSFSWGIDKAFARKQPAKNGSSKHSSKTKTMSKRSDMSSSSEDSGSKGLRKKKSLKREDVESTSSDEESDMKQMRKRGNQRHNQQSDSSAANNGDSSSPSDNQRRKITVKHKRTTPKRNTNNKQRALSSSTESEPGNTEEKRDKNRESKQKIGGKFRKAGTDDESKGQESSSSAASIQLPKGQLRLKRSEKAIRVSPTRKSRRLTSDENPRARSGRQLSRSRRHTQSPRRARRTSRRRRRNVSRSRSVRPRRAVRQKAALRDDDNDDSTLSDNNTSSSGLDVEQLRRLQQKRGKQIKRRTDFGESSDDEVQEEGSADEFENSEDGEGGEELSRSDDEYHKHLKRSLRRAFDFFDLDQTSTIDKRELGHVLRALGHEFTSKEVEAEMANADLDRNGQLDFYEFVAFVKRQLSQKTYLLSQQREMEIRQSFQTLDTDKNGALDEQEFEYLIYKVLQVELSVEEHDALLDFIDKDADGLISEDEFVTFMKKLEALHRKHIGKASWKKQKRFLESLDEISQLAYSAMKKLVRGAPMDIDRNLLMFFGIPSNFRPAISSAATCRTLQGNTMEHVLSFPSPQTIEALALDTRFNDKKDPSWFSLTRLDSNSKEYMMLRQAENVEAQAIVSLKRAAGVPKPFDTRENDVVKRCVHVCLFQEQDEVSSINSPNARRQRSKADANARAKVARAGTVIGNVHEIPVAWHPGEEDVWEFSKKSTKQDKYKFLVRTNSVNDHLYLLVEFIVHLRVSSEEKQLKSKSKRSKDRNATKDTDESSDDELLKKETREMVCCWCKIPVRQLLAKRSDIMRRKEKLWGGTANSPIDIEQDELLRRRTGWRAWTNMFTKPSLPLMGIKSVPIDSLAEDLQKFVRKMPPVVIAPFVSLPIVAEYMVLMRKILACVAGSSSVVTCEPALKLLPRIVDDHMALSIFRKLFDAEVAPLKPGEERQLKFQELVLRMWPSFVQWEERLPPTVVPPVAKSPSSLLLPTSTPNMAPTGVVSLSTSESNALQARFNLLQTTASGKLRMQDARIASTPFHVREVAFRRLL
ncbi:hypothetical protein PHYBOEH_010660 [Phytophthora boehmeriae]|uniref:EF-hand domain-containing protein n=1 Tax=Phytophthora boehmeriae TaxID=109152 RepID=A0A8T1X512_9STRA|nr:hypothetical protein PHYBOEH_010660 [Phytophthora boehmeriae]